MSNNVCNFKNIPSMPERILSALAYLTFGTVGLFMLIASLVLKTSLKPFVKFNTYQAILLGLLFFLLQAAYSVVASIFNLLHYIPFIGDFINSIFQFIVFYLMGFPILFGFSLISLVVVIILIYLTVLSMLGKLPYIPFISKAIRGFIG